MICQLLTLITDLCFTVTTNSDDTPQYQLSSAPEPEHCLDHWGQDDPEACDPAEDPYRPNPDPGRIKDSINKNPNK